MEKRFLELLTGTVESLQREGVLFAVAGGVAANTYRSNFRITGDIDFAILTDSNQAEPTARAIIEKFGFEATSLREAQLAGGPLFAIRNQSTPYHVVVGRIPDGPNEVGLDILLPQIPWVPEAVRRAQKNLVEVLGSSPLPVLTVEDVIISKLIAYNNRPTRGKDLEDLGEIISPNRSLDNAYLAKQVKAYGLKVPDRIYQNLHFTVQRAARKQMLKRGR